MKRKLKAGKRHSGGFSLHVLTDDEIYEIHLATLEALQKTGVLVEDEAAMEVFDGGGCVVDPRARVVKIPAYLVEDAIRSAPGTFVACGRIPERDIVLEHNRVSFTNFGEGIMFIDPYTGEHRKSVKADTEKAARLIDYLENIETYERAMCSHDKPHQVQALHNAEASLTNTTKHHWLGPQDGYLARKIVEILAEIVGGKDRLRERPMLTFVTCPVSPLKLVRHHCEIIMEAAKNGLGVNIIGMAMAGGSSPIHLAGTLVVQNCEVLSSLVLNQLTCKGSPFVYGSSTCPLDLRTATSSVGSPELGMISAGVARLAQYYQLPCFVAGGQGDAKITDYQAGHEKTITGLLPALAGANVIYGLGMLEMGITFDLAQLVLDNEVAGMIMHVVNGIPVNDETLSVDAIREVGIFKNYLDHESTYQHRKSQSQPKFIDRRMRSDWEASGTDIYQSALEHARHVLETHKAPELPDDVRSTIRSIIEEAEEERGVSEKKKRKAAAGV